MTSEEFNNYYNLHSIDKCCFFCKYSEGYIEWLKCTHPERDINNPEYVEATQICEAYKEKEEWNSYNE